MNCSVGLGVPRYITNAVSEMGLKVDRSHLGAGLDGCVHPLKDQQGKISAVIKFAKLTTFAGRKCGGANGPDLVASIQDPSIVSPTKTFKSRSNRVTARIYPYVQGKSFYSRIDTFKELSAEKQFRILLSLVQTVKFLHLHNVVHGDLHTNNVMVSEDFLKIFLIDFDRSYPKKKSITQDDDDLPALVKEAITVSKFTHSQKLFLCSCIKEIERYRDALENSSESLITPLKEKAIQDLKKCRSAGISTASIPLLLEDFIKNIIEHVPAFEEQVQSKL